MCVFKIEQLFSDEGSICLVWPFVLDFWLRPWMYPIMLDQDTQYISKLNN